jgi:hypothetical protein
MLIARALVGTYTVPCSGAIYFAIERAPVPRAAG